jgi:hypothetical protein
VPGAAGGAVNGVQATFGHTEVVFNSTAIKQLQTFQTSTQLQNGATLFGYEQFNLRQNSSG